MVQRTGNIGTAAPAEEKRREEKKRKEIKVSEINKLKLRGKRKQLTHLKHESMQKRKENAINLQSFESSKRFVAWNCSYRKMK